MALPRFGVDLKLTMCVGLSISQVPATCFFFFYFFFFFFFNNFFLTVLDTSVDALNGFDSDPCSVFHNKLTNRLRDLDICNKNVIQKRRKKKGSKAHSQKNVVHAQRLREIRATPPSIFIIFSSCAIVSFESFCCLFII